MAVEVSNLEVLKAPAVMRAVERCVPHLLGLTITVKASELNLPFLRSVRKTKLFLRIAQSSEHFQYIDDFITLRHRHNVIAAIDIVHQPIVVPLVSLLENCDRLIIPILRICVEQRDDAILIDEIPSLLA